MGNKISVIQYAKKNNLSRQTVYRWIREGKVPKEKYNIIEKKVKRLVIDEDFKL